MSWFFFGCDHTYGHKLIVRPGQRMDQGSLPDQVKRFMEGGADDVLRPFFNPGERTSQIPAYQACVSRFGGFGYSALSWKDFSVDSRPGSNAIVWAPSLECSPETIYKGFARFFPEQEKRFRRLAYEPSASVDLAVGEEAHLVAEKRMQFVDQRVWIPGSSVSPLGRTYFRDEDNILR